MAEQDDTRHVYALVVDCARQVDVVGTALSRLGDLIRERDIVGVTSVAVHLDVPLGGDERRQDPERTSPIISLEEM